MSCLFVHDHTGSIYHNNIYTEHFSYEMWKERYVSIFNEINVLCKSKNINYSPSSKMVLSSGKNVHYLNKIKDFHGPLVFLDSKTKKIIINEIRKNDVVIVRLDSFLGLIAARECRKLKKPYLIEVAGCAWDSFWNHGVLGKIIAPYIFLKTRYEIKKAPFVVYVTKYFLQKRYPNNHINTNCSNVFLPEISNQKRVLSNRFNIIQKMINDRNKKIIIGTTAHYDVKYKGQEYVIRAISLLKKKGYDNIYYELVGNGTGNYLKYIAKKYNVEDKIIFKGAMEHKAVLDWLETIDFYIQPSKQEGLPRSVIEAMSKGVPCLGARTAGIPELLPAKFIFSNKKNNYIEIAKLIESNINNDNIYEYCKALVEESKKYNKSIIDERRKKIFLQLKQYK